MRVVILKDFVKKHFPHHHSYGLRHRSREDYHV